MKIFAAFATLILLGCSSPPPPKITGAIRTVTCKGWANQCYYKAQEICQAGYSVISKVEAERTGGPWGRYKEFTVTFTCNGDKT